MKNLTVIIVTYQTTKNTIINCLKSIDEKINVKIIENSEKFEFQREVLATYKNVEIICTGKNLGYGGGNNHGLNMVTTDYALILNPDVICEENYFLNLGKIIKEIGDFTLIGSQYMDEDILPPAGFFEKKKNNDFKIKFEQKKIQQIEKVEWIKGFSILINLKKFTDQKIFDESYFLFNEEIDLCKSIIDKGENIFTCSDLKLKHLGFKSSIGRNENEAKLIKKMKEWHWMWSSFYFYKKNYGYMNALLKMSGKFIKSFFKLIYFSLTFQKQKREKYVYRFLGIFNSMIGNPSSFRDK